MIQRKQTLWLLLSAICAGLTFQLPFYNGTVKNSANLVQSAALTATSNIYLTVLAAATALLALITIFLFKNRETQFRLTFAGLVLSLGLLALNFFYTKNFEPGSSLSFTAIIYFLIIAGFFMALRGIKKDQKLIRDLNRLR